MTESVVVIITLIANWYIFKKIGREGWEGIVPCYNIYVLFEEIEGNGLKALWLLVPFVNIYWIFKINIDLAHCFDKTTAYGVGLTLLNPIFLSILAFTDAEYLNGIYENTNEDFLSNLGMNIPNGFKKRENLIDAVEMIEKLNDLRKEGAITDEEYEEKKKDLLKQI